MEVLSGLVESLGHIIIYCVDCVIIKGPSIGFDEVTNVLGYHLLFDKVIRDGSENVSHWADSSPNREVLGEIVLLVGVIMLGSSMFSFVEEHVSLYYLINKFFTPHEISLVLLKI